jgi:hypothetical protein
MLFQYTENLSPNGTASQSSYYYWQYRNLNLTADLAITGGRTHDFLSGSCAVTQYSPTRYRAWWMLTFPVDTIYITNVKIFFKVTVSSRSTQYSLVKYIWLCRQIWSAYDKWNISVVICQFSFSSSFTCIF